MILLQKTSRCVCVLDKFPAPCAENRRAAFQGKQSRCVRNGGAALRGAEHVAGKRSRCCAPGFWQFRCARVAGRKVWNAEHAAGKRSQLCPRLCLAVPTRLRPLFAAPRIAQPNTCHRKAFLRSFSESEPVAVASPMLCRTSLRLPRNLPLCAGNHRVAFRRSETVSAASVFLQFRRIRARSLQLCRAPHCAPAAPKPRLPQIPAILLGLTSAFSRPVPFPLPTVSLPACAPAPSKVSAFPAYGAHIRLPLRACAASPAPVQPDMPRLPSFSAPCAGKTSSPSCPSLFGRG